MYFIIERFLNPPKDIILQVLELLPPIMHFLSSGEGNINLNA